MTKRKTNPQKRGRKHLVRGIREKVYLRWRAYFRECKVKETKLTKEQIGKEFVGRNQPWFLELGIFVSDYSTLRNVLIAGRAERRARRRANWGIVTNIIGQRFFSSNALLMRHAQESGWSLIHALRKTDPN
jgi:hypothetical protein